MKKVIIYLSVLLLFLFVGLSPVYAGFEEGLAAYDRRDFKTAFQEFKPLAEQGDSAAQNYLGSMYRIGLGVSKDYTEALKWYKNAAEQGVVESQYELASMYDMGKGIPQDYAEAVIWYRKAAEQGYSEAQHNLGVMYVIGKGVPKKYVMAYMWLSLAASQGREEVSKLIRIIEKNMTPEQLAEAQRLSREFKVKSP